MKWKIKKQKLKKKKILMFGRINSNKNFIRARNQSMMINPIMCLCLIFASFNFSFLCNTTLTVSITNITPSIKQIQPLLRTQTHTQTCKDTHTHTHTHIQAQTQREYSNKKKQGSHTLA